MEIKKKWILPLLSVGFSSQAAVKIIDNINLNSIKSLSIQSGVETHVVCTNSNKSKMIAKGSTKKLKGLSYKVNNGNLFIDGGSSNSVLDFDKAIQVTLYVGHPIEDITMKYGVTLDMAACAVDSAHLTAFLSSGSKMNVSGQTDELELHVSEGSAFNIESNNFTSNSANVYCAAGSRINLLGTDNIKGTAMFGGRVQVSSNSNHRIRTIMGGNVIY